MEDFNIVDKITQAYKLLNEVDDYVKDLDDILSLYDSKLSDMYNLIENNNIDEWSKSELKM